jgi:hypothetical protein
MSWFEIAVEGTEFHFLNTVRVNTTLDCWFISLSCY